MSAWPLFLCIGGVALAGAILGWAIVRGGTVTPTPTLPPSDVLFGSHQPTIPADPRPPGGSCQPEPLAGSFDSLADLFGTAVVRGHRLYSLTLYRDGSGEYTLSERLMPGTYVTTDQALTGEQAEAIQRILNGARGS